MTDQRSRSTMAAINRLRNIGPTSNARYKCIVDSTPFDDDEDTQPSPSIEWIITVRILPNSDIYRNGAIRMQITIPTRYPMVPPIVALQTALFHPNVTKIGEVCIDLLRGDGTWTPTTTLDQVVEAVIKVIDNPSIDHIQYSEAANLWDTNRAEYESIAADTFNQNCAPRT